MVFAGWWGRDGGEIVQVSICNRNKEIIQTSSACNFPNPTLPPLKWKSL